MVVLALKLYQAVQVQAALVQVQVVNIVAHPNKLVDNRSVKVQNHHPAVANLVVAHQVQEEKVQHHHQAQRKKLFRVQME